MLLVFAAETRATRSSRDPVPYRVWSLPLPYQCTGTQRWTRNKSHPMHWVLGMARGRRATCTTALNAPEPGK